MANFTTPILLASYPHLLKASPNRNKENKLEYSVTGLWTKDAYESPQGVAMRKALEDGGIAKWGEKLFATYKDEGKFESPFRKDVVSKGYPESIFRYTASASDDQHPPLVVYPYQWVKDGVPQFNSAGKPIPAPVTDSRDLYPGVQIRLSVALRFYGGLGTKYNPGAKWDLRNVQLVGGGERLVAGGDPNEDFGDATTEQPKALDMAGMLD